MTPGLNAAFEACRLLEQEILKMSGEDGIDYPIFIDPSETDEGQPFLYVTTPDDFDKKLPEYIEVQEPRQQMYKVDVLLKPVDRKL